MALDKGGDERLLILGHNPGDRSSEKGRARAERLVNDLVQEKLRNYSEPRGGRGGRRDSRSPSRGRRDSRDRGRGRRY
jgi:hypothetical protein